MTNLLAAKRRYIDMRAALPFDCALDFDLHDELTQVIRYLDRKIASALEQQGRTPGGC